MTEYVLSFAILSVLSYKNSALPFWWSRNNTILIVSALPYICMANIHLYIHGQTYTHAHKLAYIIINNRNMFIGALLRTAYSRYPAFEQIQYTVFWLEETWA